MKSKDIQNKLQVIFFPYLHMGEMEEVDFGFGKIWNFNLKKNDYIHDAAIKDKLEKIFSMYVSGNSTLKWPMSGIGIASIGKIDFREFNEEEVALVKLMQNILFLCFLSKHNTYPFNPNIGHSMATSDNFDMVFHRINLEDDYVAEHTGSILPFAVGGFTFEEITIPKPNFVPSPSNFSLDENLLRGLVNLKKNKPFIFRRIINATEMIRQSYYNSYQVSENARILLQMSAFEILLSIPDREQRKYFKARIGAIVDLPDEKKYVNYFSKPRSSRNKEYLSLKQLWAEKFYLLRNKIIHGSNPIRRDYLFRKKQKHTDIALLFFVLAVKKQLEKSIKKYPCDYSILWKKWKDNTFNQNREEFVYEFYPARLLRQIFDRT